MSSPSDGHLTLTKLQGVCLELDVAPVWTCGVIVRDSAWTLMVTGATFWARQTCFETDAQHTAVYGHNVLEYSTV